jgi:hypothetical protein
MDQSPTRERLLYAGFGKDRNQLHQNQAATTIGAIIGTIIAAIGRKCIPRQSPDD